MISVITRHVAFFIYPKFNLIDLSGPLEAFGIASSMEPGCYRVTVMSLAGGDVESSTGVKVMSQVAVAGAIDTLVLGGDPRVSGGQFSPAAIDFIPPPAAGAPPAPRGCLGAFLLSVPGPLARRRA